MPRSSSKPLPVSAEPLPPDSWARLHQLRFSSEALLVEALTHSSYANEAVEPAGPNNERLEFLGDAVLGLVSGELVFTQLPDAPEGDLTRLRVALVRREALADLAQQLRLGEALRMSAGEIKTGGRQRTNMLADAFEALIGAIYRDQGLDAVRAFVTPMLLALVEQTLQEQNQVDARSRFHYRVEAEHGSAPTYRVIAETGPEHNREYTVEVLVMGGVWGVGTGRSKQAASQAAAAQALERMDTPVDGG
jgi:ribonuclease-3